MHMLKRDLHVSCRTKSVQGTVTVVSTTSPCCFPHKPLPRVVFDSAAKHDDICLNDCLEAGPSLHNDLPGILMRFREKPVALTGDVSDMFCHVRLEPEDCKYHRYLWRGLDVSRPPDVYEMIVWCLETNLHLAKRITL